MVQRVDHILNITLILNMNSLEITQIFIMELYILLTIKYMKKEKGIIE